MKGRTIAITKLSAEEHEAIAAAARAEKRTLANFCTVAALERADRVRT